ncbi:FAD-dependent monooxygenase [Conexibacter sp. SYSU D00693]|uniref:FAD-dependent monooxygenase n=1 Tax=Conexibacter sp. SYSU D00693 TaxID=2812560 RepID=UPI00196AB7A3|nr:FAD-dependent monooxygenase [Conexibacter sp. SYSU D00693]
MSGRGPDQGPVVVVGNGPVGQTAALLLARWGVPTTIVDARGGRDGAGSRAICQQRDVLDVWSAVGAGEQIAREGLAWERGRTFYGDRELFCTTFPDRGRSPFPPLVNISQARTEQLLDQAVAASPRIDVRWGSEVDALTQDDHGVTVGGRSPAGRFELRAPYVIACAGSRSDDLRAALGLDFPGRTFDERFLICDIRADLPGWQRERRFWFDPSWNPGRQVLVHPCPGGTYRIDWQVAPGFELAGERATGGLHRRVRQIVGDRPYELVWTSAYRFHSRRVPRMRVGRVLLAGDMAHLFSPFGARGLNSGVADAENAAWKVAFALRGWGGAALLESYDRERLAAATENLEVTTATMEFLVPADDRARRRRREVLERALLDPAARTEIDSGRFAEPYWYVDSPLTTTHPERTFSGRPPRGQAPPVVPGILVPDAPVRVPDRPGVTRLRQLVRSGLLALTTDGVEPRRALGTLRRSVTAPVQAHALASIDVEGVLAEALQARRGETWLIRPDGHLAAVVGDASDALEAAARRCLGMVRPA